MATPPVYEGRVLPTLNEDGTRRRIHPKLYPGRVYKARRVIGYALIGLFVLLPLLRINGKPLVFLDVLHREFTFFGRTFFATDGVLLMLLLLSIFVGVIWVTSLVGRAWCGWGCPQTVYMELLFRPVERLFEGDRNDQLKLDKKGGGNRRFFKNVVFGLLSLFVANVFLAYFVGTDALFQWVRSSPIEHPKGFLVVAVTASLVFFDFAYFREQMCTVICPYARLQSALLDKDSLIIGYDERRGEPRSKGKPQTGHGDCIDCSACVVACPTGIDIRQGLQLECIACGQCIDACNTIMPKVGKPPGLIRYASQSSLAGGVRHLMRARVLIYTALLATLLGALLFVGQARTGADVTVLRGIGAPFTLIDGAVQNQIRIKIENRSSVPGSYPFEIFFSDANGVRRPSTTLGARVIAPENPLLVAARGRATTSVFILTDANAFTSGKLPIVVVVTDLDGQKIEIPYQLLGPEGSR